MRSHCYDLAPESRELPSSHCSLSIGFGVPTFRKWSSKSSVPGVTLSSDPAALRGPPERGGAGAWRWMASARRSQVKWRHERYSTCSSLTPFAMLDANASGLPLVQGSVPRRLPGSKSTIAAASARASPALNNRSRAGIGNTPQFPAPP